MNTLVVYFPKSRLYNLISSNSVPAKSQTNHHSAIGIFNDFQASIMSAIDFSIDLEREADPKGDRVKIVFSLLSQL